MATSITTNWVGTDRAGYISKAFLSGATLAGEHFTVIENAKNDIILKKLDVTGGVVAGTCDFTDSGTTTLTERILKTDVIQVNKEECFKTFLPYWDSANNTPGYDNTELKIADAIATQWVKRTAQVIEQNIWSGSLFDGNGIVSLAKADSDVLDVSGSAITKSNVIAELEKVYLKIPDTIRHSDPELRIFVSPTAFAAYQLAQNALGITSNNGLVNESSFMGIRIVQAPGMTSDIMLAASKDNLFFGTDLLSDWNECKVLDMRNVDGSDNIRFVLRSTAGANYANGAEIVLWQQA